MKRKIHNVLRSRTGASITFALLLFLVCSVVGVLVLTAGTTAAGRTSNLAKMDQRYYSVTSAAKLISSELAKETVTVNRERITTIQVTTPYTVSQIEEGGVSKTVVTAGMPSDPIENKEYSTVISSGDETTEVNITGNDIPDMTFLKERVAVLLFGSECNTDEAMNASLKAGHSHSGIFTVVHTAGSVDTGSLSVRCRYVVKSDGTIVLTLTNNSDEHYFLRVTLRPTIKESQEEKSEEKTERFATATGYDESETKTTTLTKASEISWEIWRVEKVTTAEMDPDELTELTGSIG